MSQLLKRLNQLGIRHRSNVFISGTYDDLIEIREKVRIAIEETGEGALEPLYSGGSLEDIRAKVGRQIEHDADMYIGVFGTRYGTRVSTEEGALSYSHFEFLKALERWDAIKPPPIAVFTPHSTASPEFYREINDKCEKALREKYGADEVSIAEDKRLQQEFIKFVQTNGDARLGNRIIQYPRTKEHLYRLAANWVDRYKFVTTFLLIHEEARGPRRIEPDKQRWPQQLDEVQKICNFLARTAQNTYNPAVCLLIRGARGKGQAELASQIAQPTFWDNELDPVFLEIEKIDPLNENAVWRTIWDAAGIHHPNGSLKDTDELAKELLAADKTLIMVVRQIQKLEGRLKGFAERIWQPVYGSLLKASQGCSPGSQNARLIAVVTYEGADFELDQSISCDADSLPDTVDFRKVIRLTKLA